MYVFPWTRTPTAANAAGAAMPSKHAFPDIAVISILLFADRAECDVLKCNDFNDCTVDSCAVDNDKRDDDDADDDPCVHTDLGCDDNDPCTVDTCLGTTCSNTPYD